MNIYNLFCLRKLETSMDNKLTICPVSLFGLIDKIKDMFYVVRLIVK